MAETSDSVHDSPTRHGCAYVSAIMTTHFSSTLANQICILVNHIRVIGHFDVAHISKVAREQRETTNAYRF